MDILAAFAMGIANKNRELMVFDWDKAANIIKDRKPRLVVAGLAGDMEYTSGVIYENGKVPSRNETYTYLSSPWSPAATIQNASGGAPSPSIRSPAWSITGSKRA